MDTNFAGNPHSGKTSIKCEYTVTAKDGGGFSSTKAPPADHPLVGTGGDLGPRVLGADVLATLLAHDCVIAWVNGHTHTNQVWARTRADGTGLWEINTASHIDWPQQSRIIEIADNADGTLSIFTTMLDHAGLLDGANRTEIGRAHV